MKKNAKTRKEREEKGYCWGWIPSAQKETEGAMSKE
jgi:hypothetical protein